MNRRMTLANRLLALAVAIGLVTIALFVPITSAANTTLTKAEKTALVAKYAPTMHFHSGEEVYPVNVTYFLANSNLNESVNGVATLLSSNPTAVTIGSYSNPARNYYLDNRLGTINDHRIIDAYKKNESALGYTVYAHVTSNLTNIAVQYWFFYVFNAGTHNSHEGDWEMIEIILDTDRAPLSAAYSQHEAGQKAPWSLVEKNGDGPVTYVAKGSHANYYRSYQGKMGPAQDEVGNNGKVLRPSDYSLELLGEKGIGNHPASQNWLDYSGRWGDWGNQTSEVLGQRGPLGPAYRMDGQMWEGLSWADTRTSIDANQLLLEQVLSYSVLIVLALLVVPSAFMLRRVHKKRKTGELRPPYVYLFDIRGKDLRSIGNILAIAAIVVGLVAAFMPFYEASIDAKTGAYATNGYERFLLIDGISGIQISTLEIGGGTLQLGALPFPIWALIAVGIIAFVISMVAREPRKAGRKYMARGVGLMIPLLIMVVAIAAIGGLASSIGGTPGDDSIQMVLKAVSSDPMGGEERIITPDFGSVSLKWGLGIGAYLLMFAGILLVIAGALQYALRREDGREQALPQAAPSYPPPMVQYDAPAPEVPSVRQDAPQERPGAPPSEIASVDDVSMGQEKGKSSP